MLYYPILVPHSPQNLKPSAIGLPQFGHIGFAGAATGASNLFPHSKQNFVPSEFNAPHAEQTFPAGAASTTGVTGAS